MIQTENHGPLIRSSTYWGSELERGGYYYLTPNAGSFRLLVPENKSADVADMRTAKNIVITFGLHKQHQREMVEILFDDRTANPFVLYLSLEQLERLPAEDDYELLYECSVWENRRGMAHKIFSRPAYLRKAPLPCLKPIKKYP